MKDKQRILIVDDVPENIEILHNALQDEYRISAVTNGTEALEMVASTKAPDLILLDVMMPEMDGYEVCRRLKADKKAQNIPVLFITSLETADSETKGLELGAADYITKPINSAVVKARVRNQMELLLHRYHLEGLVATRTRQLRQGQIDTIHRLTLASEYKDEDTGVHIKRISHYTKELALQMGADSGFAENIFYASPMHDIGKVAIPDAILLKNGPLDDHEWIIMQSHAAIGAKILEGSDSPYLKMAVDIAHYHHERWDGKGYPRGLKGKEIPLTARIMNIADQYDALRSQRPYKPPIDHRQSVAIIMRGDGRTMPEHFDPEVLAAFAATADTFADIYDAHKAHDGLDMLRGDSNP